jgi:predicted transcriptional regulator
MDNSTKAVVELLGKGIPQVDIARMFECSGSAISQIASTYDHEIADIRAGQQLVKQGTDAAIDRIEAALLVKIENGMESESDLRILAGMFKVMNSAVRRSAGESPTGAQAGGIAQLHLHQNFIGSNIQYVKNAQNEIVKVGDTNLTTAHSDVVRTMAHEDKNAKLKAKLSDLTLPTGKEITNDLFGDN